MLPRLSRLALAPIALILLASAAPAQLKVAMVDMREAVNSTSEVKKAVAALEAKMKPKQTEADRLQREMQDIQNKLQTLQGKLTPEGQNELTVAGQRKQKELQRIQEDVNAELEREQQDVGTRSLQRMRDVVKKIAEAQQLDIVMDVSQTIFFKPALNITKTAIEAYDKAYPAK